MESMQGARAKSQMIGEMPRLTARYGLYFFMTVHLGKQFSLDPRQPPKKQLSLLSSDVKMLKPIKEIIDGEYRLYRRNLTIFHNGSWVKAEPVKTKKKDMYRIVTSNNKEVIVTENHIFPTIVGDVMAKNLTTNDYMSFNTRKLDSYPEKDNHRTYEQGFIIGLYAGDGSAYIPKNENYSNRITFSLNKNNKKDIEIIQKCLNQFNILTKLNIHE